MVELVHRRASARPYDGLLPSCGLARRERDDDVAASVGDVRRLADAQLRRLQHRALLVERGEDVSARRRALHDADRPPAHDGAARHSRAGALHDVYAGARKLGEIEALAVADDRRDGREVERPLRSGDASVEIDVALRLSAEADGGAVCVELVYGEAHLRDVLHVDLERGGSVGREHLRIRRAPSELDALAELFELRVGYLARVHLLRRHARKEVGLRADSGELLGRDEVPEVGEIVALLASVRGKVVHNERVVRAPGVGRLLQPRLVQKVAQELGEERPLGEIAAGALERQDVPQRLRLERALRLGEPAREREEPVQSGAADVGISRVLVRARGEAAAVGGDEVAVLEKRNAPLLLFVRIRERVELGEGERLVALVVLVCLAGADALADRLEVSRSPGQCLRPGVEVVRMRGRIHPAGVGKEPEFVAEARLDREARIEEGVEGDLLLVEDGRVGVRRRLDLAHVCGRLDAEEALEVPAQELVRRPSRVPAGVRLPREEHVPQLQAPPGVVAESGAVVRIQELLLLVRTPCVLEVEQRVEVPLARAALELRHERGAVRREGVALGEFEVRELREVVGAADCGCERQRPCGHRLFHRIAAFLFIRSPHTAAIVPETRPRVNREDESRFTSPIVFCYTTQRTQGSACQHGLRSECCDG